MGKGRPIKTEYIPKNPKKYVGQYPIICRSSWESSMCALFDTHPSIITWASENVSIQYKNPLTNKWSMYIPDFMINYMDKNNKLHTEMIEVKPLKELPGQPTKNTVTKLVQVINQAKWTAAINFCRKRGIKFRVMTEDQIFGARKDRK